jgi:uncharacterized protein (DUF1800 family)
MSFPYRLVAAVVALALGLPSPSLAAQKPAHKPARMAYVSSQLQGDQRIVHALNRFTFGPRPGDVDAVRRMGLDAWFEAQLHPAGIDQTALHARLAEYPAMRLSVVDLQAWLPGNAMIRQAMNDKRPVPAYGLLHAVYENQIYRMEMKKPVDRKAAPAPAPGLAPAQTAAQMPQQVLVQQTPAMVPAAMTPPAEAPDGMADADVQSTLALPPEERVARLAALEPAEFESFIHALHGPQRQALNAGLTPEQRETVGALENPEKLVGDELIAQRLTRDIYSNAQLEEVMTGFWFNHFNIYLRKNEQMPYYLVGYERDTIRPHALGRFEDLLEAVAHSPAMMLYLDNAASMGPDSPAAVRSQHAPQKPDARRKASEGLNENYARELMELHTLGVNGGYTQADVIQVARVLTGWTVDRPQYGGGFLFTPNRHEPGAKTVLGTEINEGGEAEGRALLHLLAMQPATAHFLAHKLAVRFVSDTPPPALEERLAKAYLASGGDMAQVLRTLFHAPEFWQAENYRAKVKTPLEYVVSAARASNAQIDNLQPLANALRQMGMPLYGAMPPTGYKWDAANWVSTAAMVSRMNFALGLAANRLGGITTAWSPTAVAPTPEAEEARLEGQLLVGGSSVSTRSAAVGQIHAVPAQFDVLNPNPTQAAAALDREDRLLAGLLLGSPEFQRR